MAIKHFLAPTLILALTLQTMPAFAQGDLPEIDQTETVTLEDQNEVAADLEYAPFELGLGDQPNGTCADDFQKFHRQMAWKAGLALPASVVGGAALMYIGGVTGAALGQINDKGGWGGLAGAVAGVGLTGAGSVVTYVVVQVTSLVHLIQSGTMKRVIDEAYLVDQGAAPGKNLLRFHEKMIRKYREVANATPTETANILVRLDHERALCDGSLKKKKRHPKLKDLLATPAEARKAVATGLTEGLHL